MSESNWDASCRRTKEAREITDAGASEWGATAMRDSHARERSPIIRTGRNA
jgi:hypothetical protein